MQRKGGPRLLMTDREGALYLERARIAVEDNRIVYFTSDDEYARRFNIPHVNLAVLFIGQGTSITQDAMRLLGEEGVHLAVTGSGGTPMHMGTLTTYTATRHFREILPVYQNTNLSLAAAKSVMRDRAERMKKIGGVYAKRLLRVRDTSLLATICKDLESDLDAVTNIPQLLGVEGKFSKRCYAAFAKMSGPSKHGEFRRLPGAGHTPDLKDPIKMINHLIDHGNYLCYGMAGAALWALGIPPHLSIFHGKTRAGGLVFDVADSFKDALVLPMAFASMVSKRDVTPETTFRARMIDAFDDREILKESVATINRMIEAGSPTHGDADA